MDKVDSHFRGFIAPARGGKTAVIKHIFVDALKFQLTSTKANNLLQNYGPALFKDLIRPILFVP